MTSRRIPRAGDKYRHFKGNNYQIITIAKDSETLAPMVVYQGLYGDFEIYVRPMSDFLAELDKSTYPEATQQYRFEPLDGSESGAMDYSAGYETSAAPHREAVATPRDTTAPAFQTAAAPASQRAAVTASKAPQSEVAASPESGAEGFSTASDVTEWMMRFFDADDFNEKYAILKAMKNMEGITNNIIDNMAATLDYVIDDGDIEDRFAQLMKCVSTRRRFETGRLR